MDPEHRRKFRDTDLISALVACIDFDVLAPSLHSRGILTAAMVDDIREKEGLDERNLALLQRLPKRGPLAFDRFVAILREKRMFQAVTLLTGETPPEPPVPTVVPPPPRSTQAFGGGDARLVVDSAQNGHGTVGEASSSELRVVPAKDLKHGDNIYSMVHSPRGLCIIINNCDFGGLAERRDGSEIDVRRMEALFRAFLFNCIVRHNLPASDMKALLSWAAQPKQQEGADCLVVILMSHGKQDMIDGSDGEQLHLASDVYALFNNEHCEALQGKPKLFFIQACRGSKFDSGTYDSIVYDTADAGPFKVPESVSSSKERMATWSDMYIAYATIPGYTALKNNERGSWFLSAVYTVFSEHASTMHLEKLMHRVHDAVMRWSSHDGSKQTPSVELVGWRKKLYFNPGFFVERRPEEPEVFHTAL
ncbi:caspase-7-like isoform X1 [Dermacentor albipictus]|uniref:caspase-7-like isoform X1 n=1 Tax=Dermacentor albipictus TaxID=60249 RepID=UPI0031FC8A36